MDAGQKKAARRQLYDVPYPALISGTRNGLALERAGSLSQITLIEF